jgi:hypothetical protein
MGAEQTKKTVMALVQESTAGTPVKPTAGTDYIALQDGFDVEPAFETLENAEFTGSLGSSKPILGIENPTVSLNHYIRHSGVEGQEPGFGILMEAAMGDKKVVATERDTIAGSTAGDATTAPVINVDAGEGVDFERGHAILIKDSVRSIRNVKSVSGDVLTANFNLETSAPGTGVNLGKAILYKPSETHPSISVWTFRGNGTAMELVAGARVTELSIEANAGELVNGSFSLNGTSYSFNPLEVITASNNKIDFNDGGGEENVSITVGTYKDPHDLAAAIQTAMDAATVDNITVTYDDTTGKFTIASDGVTLSLLWNTGTNTAQTIGGVIGFDVAADDTLSTSYEGDNAVSLASFQSAVFDSADPLVAKANEVTIGDHADNVCFDASTMTISLSNTITDDNSVCAESGVAEKLITEREVTVEITATLDRYEADKFKRFRTNETTEFMYNFGEKTGGNWVEGKSVNVYLPAATISSFKVADNDGIISLEMTLTAFVDAGLGEFYINFL